MFITIKKLKNIVMKILLGVGQAHSSALGQISCLLMCFALLGCFPCWVCGKDYRYWIICKHIWRPITRRMWAIIHRHEKSRDNGEEFSRKILKIVEILWLTSRSFGCRNLGYCWNWFYTCHGTVEKCSQARKRKKQIN